MNSNRMGIVFRLVCVLLVFWAVLASQAVAQIYQVKEMNTEQIRALDREKTVVLLPGGILEQHGPYLPSFADGYMNERLTLELANAIVERPGWRVLVFPLIPLGVGGANEIPGKYSFSGTYAVRFSTLRAVFNDLANELGEQGFRWVFVVHLHGAPNHNAALDQAGDYFRDVYRGHMVNLTGLMSAIDAMREVFKLMSDEERREDGNSTHAGMNETSRILYLRPELVNPAHKTARSLPYRDRDERIQIGKAEDWPGYWGSPRLASASFGAKAWRLASSQVVDLALKILDGLDYRQIKRIGDIARTDPVSQAALEHDRRNETKQQEWLKKKGLE